jgi:hypothetical protein
MQIQRIPLKKIIFIFLVILYSVELAQAGEQITLSPDGGHSNQNQINAALEKGDVYLSAGVYEDDDTILIPPNRALRGDQNAIVRVWSGSSQWFVGLKGVISCGDVVAHDIVISGFQIDGNIGSLPKGYANSRSDTDHDCQKLIILHGYSSQFASNITISNMKLYNSFSDGIYVLFGDHIECYDNFISNCQHEGIYLSCLKNSAMYRNKIAGITSDCARLDCCVNCKVYDNLFFSYTGESYGAWKGGQAGLQIANTGSSHGYDGSKKPQKTDNVEVYNNTFADPGRQAIWLHNYDGNVFVHDNHFVNAAGLETQGIPVGDISVDNPPTLEMSENVFSSIFDILNMEFPENATTTQTEEDFNYTIKETENGKVAGGIKILGFNNWIVLNNQTYIPSMDAAIVKTSIIRNPALIGWLGGVSDIQKTVNISIENNTVIAVLTAKVKWYNIKTNSEGKHIKKYKTSEYNFSDAYYPAPKLFEQPSNITGIIYQYPTYFTLSVPSGGLTKLHYEYKDNSSEHIFLVGTRNYTENGVMFTEYSKLEHWEGNLQHQGKWIFGMGQFNENKLKVTAYTPFKTIEVKKFDLIKVEYPGKIIAWWFYPFILTLIILLLGIRYMWKQIIF